ncbi:MAG: hypothetical protein H9W81_08325 [Enterococcus sp.]|nr:hypothetical protein [Enterococcus sp.]
MLETVQVMEPDRVKTLSLKILTSYWVSDYIQAQQVAFLPPEKMPPNFTINMATCLARKNVADAVKILIENRKDCGEDIFLPLLKLRCQKEISATQQKLNTESADRDYLEASQTAWNHVLKIIE